MTLTFIWPLCLLSFVWVIYSIFTVEYLCLPLFCMAVYFSLKSCQSLFCTTRYIGVIYLLLLYIPDELSFVILCVVVFYFIFNLKFVFPDINGHCFSLSLFTFDLIASCMSSPSVFVCPCN